MSKNDVKECKKIEQNYLCEKTHPTYRINIETPCEIEMYLQRQRYRDNCNTKHVILNNTLWIPLHNPYEWLYSAVNEAKIAISCKNYREEKISIRGTGKMTLQDNCKIITHDMTIENKETIQGENIETYLPETNIPLLRDSNDSRQDIKDIVHNRAELIELKKKTKKLKQRTTKQR